MPFWDCVSLLADCIWDIMQLHIPGTNLSFLSLAVGLAFLPVLINVFARVFGGVIGVDEAMRTGRYAQIKSAMQEDDSE